MFLLGDLTGGLVSGCRLLVAGCGATNRPTIPTTGMQGGLIVADALYLFLPLSNNS